MNKDIMKALYEPFEVKERRGVGNQTFKYVSSEDIVDRMNKVFQGDWSTEIREEKVVEDQVLMCVRVYARDAESNHEFWQDGYASHPLARYTSGQNQGKIIDIGNSYKSAMSKAIKTAVAKWGVGLYLEPNEDTDTPVFTAPVTTRVPLPEPNPSITPKKVSGPPMNIPIEVKPQNTSVSKPPVNGPPIDGLAFGGGHSKPKITQPPVFTVENVAPARTLGFDLPSGGGIERMTDVQRVAIESMMGIHNIKFDELVSKALARQSNIPKSFDEITYLDAVTIIQYGNELRRV